MTEPMGRFSATDAIGRGLDEAPVLRQGLGVTWLFAALGAGGRVVVPIIVQQAIDRGIIGRRPTSVDLRFVVWCAVIAVVALSSSPRSASAPRSSGSAPAANRRSTTCGRG